MARPGGPMASRPLHFFWVVDSSGSMSGDKIETVNIAIRESVPEMRRVADENPNAQMFVRALRFGDEVDWHPTAKPTPVDHFMWTDLKANGETKMGHAFSMLAEEFTTEKMGDRALPPVVVLMTDGQPTDDWRDGLRSFLDLKWGMKAVRIGIAIGTDADRRVIQDFIGNTELPVLEANNAPSLVRNIKWASTVVVRAAAAPPSTPADQATPAGNIVIPQPPMPTPNDPQDAVW